MEADTKIGRYAQCILACLLAAVPVAVLHRSTFGWLFERYMAADSYYSHGFLVPVVTGALIWMKRGACAGIPLRQGNAGLVFVIAALLVHLVSLLLQVHFLSGFALFFLVFGTVFFIFGPEVTRRLGMPLSFLVFMFPLPLVFINAVSFPLKIFVAQSTALILRHLFGLPLRLEGFRIVFPGASLIIENPCSGLRSIIVMLALGFIFAYLSDGSKPKKLLLFLLSIPVAVVSNMLRVLLLSIAVYVYGERMAGGFFHDATGYLVFLTAFAAMYGLWRLFKCRT
ncbi:MAG: exosortase/archaeosortase family protein [Deltaproteobacteria bacterium]